MDDARPPSALTRYSQIRAAIGHRSLGFFLDFDGTLTPLAPRPELAILSKQAKNTLTRLANSHLVCIVSGRGLEDLRARVAVPGVFYAADHGFRIMGPPGSSIFHEVGRESADVLKAAARQLKEQLAGMEGVIIEEKGLSLSVHYRLAPPSLIPTVRQAVQATQANLDGLRLTTGKCVFEFRPAVAWDKGKAMIWLLEHLGHSRETMCPVCLGDDRTDEDTFRAAAGWGISVLVGSPDHATSAAYRLQDTNEVLDFLSLFAAHSG